MGRIECGGGEGGDPALSPPGWKSYASWMHLTLGERAYCNDVPGVGAAVLACTGTSRVASPNLLGSKGDYLPQEISVGGLLHEKMQVQRLISQWLPQALSWISQPEPEAEIAGDRRKHAPSLRRYRRARSLAALLRSATPPNRTRSTLPIVILKEMI